MRARRSGVRRSCVPSKSNVWPKEKERTQGQSKGQRKPIKLQGKNEYLFYMGAIDCIKEDMPCSRQKHKENLNPNLLQNQ